MIAINENLEKYAAFDPTKDSKSVSIGTLCKDIEEGKMTLPVFQTYIRWSLEKSVELLNFQLKGMAPVAPISINIIENKDVAIPQVSFIERLLVPVQYMVSKFSVIDGQQRLSCNYKAYTNHPDFKCIVLDLSLGEFVINTGEIKDNQIPVGVLYNKDQNVLGRYVSEKESLKDFTIHRILTEVRTKFIKYYYTVNYATDLTETEQLEWFEVLNLAGSRVPRNQVFLTEMLVKEVDFYREYSDEFYKILSLSNYNNLFDKKNTEISVPLAILNSSYEVIKSKPHTSNFSPIPSDAKGPIISKESPDTLRKMFELALNGLLKSINFIKDNNLKAPSRIDYLSYLTGMHIYMSDKELNEKQIDAVIDWYNNVEFSKKDNTTRRDLFSQLIEIRYIH